MDPMRGSASQPSRTSGLRSDQRSGLPSHRPQRSNSHQTSRDLGTGPSLGSGGQLVCMAACQMAGRGWTGRSLKCSVSCMYVSGALRRRACASARVSGGSASGRPPSRQISAGGTKSEAVGRSHATIGPLSVLEGSPRVRSSLLSGPARPWSHGTYPACQVVALGCEQRNGGALRSCAGIAVRARLTWSIG